jgi:hypothetical protein
MTTEKLEIGHWRLKTCVIAHGRQKKYSRGSGDVNEEDDPNALKWPPEAENVCYSSREDKNVESGGPETLTRMTTENLEIGHWRLETCVIAHGRQKKRRVGGPGT